MEKSKFALTLILLSCTVFILSSCESKMKSNETSTIVEVWKDDRVRVKKEINNLINEIDDEIVVIEENMEDVSEDAVDKWNNHLAELKSSKSQLQKSLDEVDDQTADNWSKFKKNLNNRFDIVKVKISKVGNEMEEAIDG